MTHERGRTEHGDVDALAERSGRFGSFVAVGALGFAVDASILTALVSGFGWTWYSARAVSFAAAVTTTWLCNRRWVFQKTSDARREYATYVVMQVVGALINLMMFALLIELVPRLASVPVVPLAGAAAVALLFNYFAARRWVFGGSPPQGRVAMTERSSSTGATPYTGVDNLEVMLEAKNYNRYLLGLVRKHLGKARRVVDFGAGAGTFASSLAAIGVALAPVEPDAALRAVLASLGLTAIADARSLPNDSFDYAYTLNVLEHIEDDVSALRVLRSKLAVGARLLVYVPAFPILFTSMDRKVGHMRRYTRRTLRATVEAAGFAVDDVRYADSLGFLATLAFKIFGNDRGELNRRAVRLYDRLAFPLSRALDTVTYRWLGKNLALVAHNPAR
jgi:putative flippase GtrA